MAEPLLIVIAPPAERSLALLDRLPGETRIIAGDTVERFQDAPVEEAGVVLTTGPLSGLLRPLWPRFRNVKWIHSLSAGLDNTLFPELVESSIPLTNSRGVYARSLAEFALAGMLWFAKDLDRMRTNQRLGRWAQFDVDELAGRTLGIVGYGEIGHAVATRAKAFQMRVHALRRRPDLSRADAFVDRVYQAGELLDLCAASDYLLASAPLTPATQGMLGEPQFRALKPSSIFINLGRGPVAVESALVRALRERWIRGAVLDVYEREPLPDGHPFYELENVLLSPHCADHTATWTEDSMLLFLDNYERFRKGEPLRNVADKRNGY
jgi:phosphoglycerate dehydrogenase-like enzyme